MVKNFGEKPLWRTARGRKAMAAALLGALHSQRKGFCESLRVHSLQPGEAWVGGVSCGLGVFECTSVFAGGVMSSLLGRIVFEMVHCFANAPYSLKIPPTQCLKMQTL